MYRLLIALLAITSAFAVNPRDLLIQQRNDANTAQTGFFLPISLTDPTMLVVDPASKNPMTAVLGTGFSFTTGSPGALVVSLTKADVGLGNADNTSDADKPVSTATQTALNLKANIADLSVVSSSGDYSDLLNVPTLTNGTLTSITAGTGLSGGTITTSGTISLPATGTAGTYGIVTTDAQGRVTAGKRQETYSGTTDGSGNYTVTFGTSYGAAPNIQAQLLSGTDTQLWRVTSITSSGFTVNVRNRADVLGLLPSYSNVSSASINVLVTEK